MEIRGVGGAKMRTTCSALCTLSRFAQTSVLADACVSHTFQCPRIRVNLLPVCWQHLLLKVIVLQPLLVSFSRGVMETGVWSQCRRGL